MTQVIARMNEMRRWMPRAIVACWVAACCLAVGGIAAAQASPFDGTWVAEVPPPAGGRPVRFVLALEVTGDRVTGTIKIGAAEAVTIEEGRLRGDVLSFRRTLGDDGTRVQFLARIVDGDLRVGFMQRPAPDAPDRGTSPEVVNFTAKRLSRRHP